MTGAPRETIMRTGIWLYVVTQRQKSHGCCAHTSTNIPWYVLGLPGIQLYYINITLIYLCSDNVCADCALQRRIPIAAVHLCFAAAVIHLIDARPSNPNRPQGIRHLQTCVDVLQDLRTAWCTWSDRALRAVRLLAREWYQCEDVSQLQSCGGPSGPAGLADDQPRGPSHAGPDLEADDQSDALAFLFDAATPGQYMDSLVKDWLVESGYDMFNAVEE